MGGSVTVHGGIVGIVGSWAATAARRLAVMVTLNRIYTRTGDNGTTGYGGRGRISKNDTRLVAYAECDEANSALGVAVAAGDLDDDVRTAVARMQNDLFDVGADLCTPIEPDPKYPPLRVTQEQIDAVEREIDRFNEGLEPLRSFVLPGGTPGAAHLHVARTVVRRAERATWAALEEYRDTMNDLTAKYLNRASDLLFVLARYANREGGDVVWVPGANR
jgi:cob(I)alamin adenosyltransferase